VIKCRNILFLLIILLGLHSCHPTRHLVDEQILLTKVKLNVSGKITEDELVSVVKQQPNRKIVGSIRFHLGVYNMVDKQKLEIKIEAKQQKLGARNAKRARKDKQPKQYKRTRGEWLMEDVGEAPVIYDEILKDKSIKQLNQFLKNKGYFNGNVSDSVLIDGQKATIHYNVVTGDPYRIRKLKFKILDSLLFYPIKLVSKKSLLEPGANYDVDMLEKERTRIEKALKNQGYFNFSREYVYFEIDSNLNKHKVDIKQVIEASLVPSKQNTDSLIVGSHKTFFINNVYVNSDYNPRGVESSFDTIVNSGINYLLSDKANFRPEVLSKAIFVHPGDLYRLKNVEYTNSRLSALRAFRFINVTFEEVYSYDGISRVDCFINLVPIAKHSFVSELETTTNRMAPLGVSGGFLYRNKNTFRGAELFELKFAGGVEAQKQLTDNGTAQTASNFFNTVEFGPEISLFIPGLFIPKIYGDFPRFTKPKTSFSIAYNHQTRLDYKRNILSLNISYNWKTSRYLSHNFQPVDINLVSIDKSAAFENQLQATNNRFLINTYQNHLIVASNYTLIYNNQEVTKKYSNSEYFMFNLEGAGNILRGVHNLASAPKNTSGNYEMFDIQFAQYIKPEVDLRLYRVVNRHSNMVYRLFAGVGIPLKNLDVLPFEKSYFAGGANGVRAWTARTLGPGTLSDTASSAVDRIGDIQLEGNIEYRFDIIEMLEGAAFVDLGNIWLRNNDEQRVGGQFEIDNFYKATAIGIGVGARFDFSFLIVRLDVAMPFKDPSLIEGERWLYQPKVNSNKASAIYYGTDYSPYKPKLNFNFGIGYPF
jgi:outer membrane protein assembly factor BamA